jgi:hypothetical protein
MDGKVLLFGDTGQLLHELDHDGKVLSEKARMKRVTSPY